MKIIRFRDLSFIPASHENPKNPGAFKKVLAKKDDLVAGRVQMINWAKLPIRKSFEKHYHEDMEEIFIILNGKTEIMVNNENDVLEKGDTVIIPIAAVHQMTNLSNEDVNYIAFGVSTEKGGKTINV